MYRCVKAFPRNQTFVVEYKITMTGNFRFKPFEFFVWILHVIVSSWGQLVTAACRSSVLTSSWSRRYHCISINWSVYLCLTALLPTIIYNLWNILESGDDHLVHIPRAWPVEPIDKAAKKVNIWMVYSAYLQWFLYSLNYRMTTALIKLFLTRHHLEMITLHNVSGFI